MQGRAVQSGDILGEGTVGRDTVAESLWEFTKGIVGVQCLSLPTITSPYCLGVVLHGVIA